MDEIDWVSIHENYIQLFSRYFGVIASRLKDHLKHFVQCPRIDKISCRPKGPDSFIKKAHRLLPDGRPRYVDPLRQIQDQIGGRIVTYFKDDIDSVRKIVEEVYRGIETRLIVPDDEKQFGYEGFHYILAIPLQIMPEALPGDEVPTFFELQIKTLFQHAWAQAEHDITYKTDYPWTKEQRRKVAFTAAQAWGADMIFDQLHLEQQK